jgi:hypothetical protein
VTLLKNLTFSICFGLLIALPVGAADRLISLPEAIHDEISVGVVGHTNCNLSFDRGSLKYEATLSDQDVSDMLAAIDNGGSVAVEYTTDAAVVLLGDAIAGYQLRIITAVEHLDGSRARLDARVERRAAPPEFDLRTFYSIVLEREEIEALVDGDNLFVWAIGRGYAHAVTCSQFHQASLNVDFASAGRPLLWIRGIP